MADGVLEPGPPGPEPVLSPFRIGFAAAVGVGLAYLIFRSLVDARDSIVLISLALFLAIGLDPAVRLVERTGVRRGLAVGAVFILITLVFVGFGFAVVPPLVDQTTQFVHNWPSYVNDLEHNHRVASLNRRFHILDRIQQYLQSGDLEKSLAGNVVSAGTAAATTIFEGFTVLILTLYFMAYLDEIRSFARRLAPRSRRERFTEISDRISAQLGDYVAGNLVLALIAGTVTLLWMWIVNAPFPFALAFVVALLDVIPLAGAPIAAIIATGVVLSSSTTAGIATGVFFVVYQLVENYVVTPRLLHNVPKVNPAATIIGALAGYTLLGVIGFIVAIPLVAVIDLWLHDIVIPRQTRR
jgi:predicted PurR-regulated permease PerM